jgi:hypothetical protein
MTSHVLERMPQGHEPQEPGGLTGTGEQDVLGLHATMHGSQLELRFNSLRCSFLQVKHQH